jgi:hypothetical protein
MVLCLSKPMRDPLAQIVSSDNAGLMKNQGQVEIAGCCTCRIGLSQKERARGSGAGLESGVVSRIWHPILCLRSLSTSMTSRGTTHEERDGRLGNRSFFDPELRNCSLLSLE